MMQEHHAYTFAHSLRVGILMAAYGRHLGLDDDHVKLMAETGLAHDVGKLRIPIDILAKPVRLTDAEMAVMRTHRSEEHTSELQSLMRISYAVFCLKKKNNTAP